MRGAEGGQELALPCRRARENQVGGPRRVTTQRFCLRQALCGGLCPRHLGSWHCFKLGGTPSSLQMSNPRVGERTPQLALMLACRHAGAWLCTPQPPYVGLSE